MVLYVSSATLAVGIDEGVEAQPAIIFSKHTNTNKRVGNFMRGSRFYVLSILFLVLLTGCAPEVVRSAIAYTAHTGSKELIQFTRSATIPNFTGTGNTLYVGTRWERVGDVVHGAVYRSRDSVFFLQSANSHEAYLVIKDKKLVGFYLPGDKAWSALAEPLNLEFSVN